MKPAPDFTLPDQDGTMHNLHDYLGSWVVLYFYPKDDTPGCTIEACSMRDAHDELAELGAHVIGMSKDDASSHRSFKQKHTLNFTLLTDADAAVMRQFGAWGRGMYGREGVKRKTFIINPEGLIAKEFGRVTPNGHGQQIIDELKELKAAASAGA